MLKTLALICLVSVSSCVQCQNLVNDRPIIGILVEEVNNTTYAPGANSSLYASYVKFVESAGGRVVPIWIYKPEEYYQDIMSKINGVLFPGGGDLLRSNGYGRSGRIIYEIAKTMNDNGDYFPLWGTCLGFELLNYAAINQNWMTACQSEDLPTNIDFQNGYLSSRMFANMDDLLHHQMSENNVTIHFHRWCLTPENYTTSGLTKHYRVLATNKDWNNLDFVSIVEALDYPFYGVSFHPEKVQFEWKLSKSQRNSPHSYEAIRTSQYFGNFFINEARKSSHHFSSPEEENAYLIYNYNPIFTGKNVHRTMEQMYYFQE